MSEDENLAARALATQEGRQESCPECGACPLETEVHNFDRMWGEGDVCCVRCGFRVRLFDSG